VFVRQMQMLNNP